MTERYSREEVDAILGRAVERERSGSDLSREQLIAIAQEVGVSADAVDRAIQEVVGERKGRDELARLRRGEWRGFVYHLIPYVCVNALFVVLNLYTTDFPFALFPALGWGIGLVLHFLNVAFPNPEHLEHLLERGRGRQRRRELKGHRATSAEQFEVSANRMRVEEPEAPDDSQRPATDEPPPQPAARHRR